VTVAKLTQAQRREYVKNGGPACPFCKSLDIEGGSMEIDSGYCWQSVRCNGCNERWTDNYTLTGLTYEVPRYSAEDMARAIWAEPLAKSDA